MEKYFEVKMSLISYSFKIDIYREKHFHGIVSCLYDFICLNSYIIFSFISGIIGFGKKLYTRKYIFYYQRYFNKRKKVYIACTCYSWPAVMKWSIIYIFFFNWQ